MPNYPYAEMPRAFVNALGIETAYYEMGTRNGRPVILLHGMSTSADSFRETMHELAGDLWLIAPDIPGFGHSGSATPYTMPHLIEWLAAFRSVLDLPPAALIGHSFGGTLAVEFVLSYPNDVTRLFLVAPALLRAESYSHLVKKVGFSLGIVDLGMSISQSSFWVKRQIKAPFYAPEKQDESVWARRLQDYDLARASTDVIKATAFNHMRPRLKLISHPTCLVWGENDPVVPVSDADQLSELMPNVQQIHKLAECGHTPILEQQEQVQALARAFLKIDV
jgi:4,5:9,10-diseco-3-hydroxy-5,9,17-trioxoandrosta-1(10),2-diene-4-oate hydrolase